MKTTARPTNDGDTFTHAGLTFRLNLEPDTDHGAPWDEEDGHGDVRHVGRMRCPYTGNATKRPGERPMYDRDRDVFLYDWEGAMRKARAEGWGLSDADRAALAAKLGREPTAGEVTAEAVRRDFEYLRGWVRGDWGYTGAVVTLLDVHGCPTDERASLWGIDSDSGEYFAEVADDLAAQIADRIGDARVLTGPQVRP